MMRKDVGVTMGKYSIVFLAMLVMQIFATPSSAAALNGCLATGINGGCISCSGTNCSLTGPSGSTGNRIISLDGGVNRVSCSSSGCSPLDNFRGQACIAQRAACFNCSASSCRLTNVSAQSLIGGTFSGINLNNFMGLGNVGQMINFDGVNVNNLIPNLNQLSDFELSSLLNQNADLSRMLGSSNVGSAFLNRVNGLTDLNSSARNLLGVASTPGGVFGGGLGGGSTDQTVREYSGTAPNDLLGGAVADQLYGDPEAMPAIQQFDGRPSAERGLGGSPILFDPKNENIKRKYPELAASEEHDSGALEITDYIDGFNNDGVFSLKNSADARPSFAALELGSDLEIRKSSWGVFQPINKVQKNFAESEEDRDSFLDRYQSAIGIAKTTLEFLDPTVASSLHKVQNQIDANVTNTLLKQATWSLDQMANPQNSFIHADVNEKLEACLSGLEEGHDERVSFGPECEKSIADGGCGADLNSTENSFAACQCCAEASNTVNKTLKEGEGGKGYSLVDRIFYGTKMGNSNSDSMVAIEEVVKAFRELYGDVLMISDGSDVIKVSYKLPSVSIPQKIAQFRDAKGLEGCSGLTCPQTQQKIQHGICPSIVKMMTSYKDKDKVQNREEYEIEASLGTILTAGNYEQMAMMAGVRFEDLPEDWEPTKDEGNALFKQWLNNFCDASAYVALNKLHTNMKAVVYDHLQLNSKATSEEKAQILRLMDRFSAQFGLAESGTGKEQYLHQMLGSMGLRADRQQMASVNNTAMLANNSGAPGAATFGAVPGVSQTCDPESGDC